MDDLTNCAVEHYTPLTDIKDADGDVVDSVEKPGTTTQVRHLGKLIAAAADNSFTVYDNGSTICAHSASGQQIFEVPKTDGAGSVPPSRPRRGSRTAEE